MSYTAVMMLRIMHRPEQGLFCIISLHPLLQTTFREVVGHHHASRRHLVKAPKPLSARRYLFIFKPAMAHQG
jgi:hypothetical protein